MALNADALKTLWNLLQVGLVRGDGERAGEWVASIYGRGLELPSKVGSLLAAYLSRGEQSILWTWP